MLKFDSAGIAAVRALPPGTPVVAAAGSRCGGVPHAILDDTAGAVAATELPLRPPARRRARRAFVARAATWKT